MACSDEDFVEKKSGWSYVATSQMATNTSLQRPLFWADILYTDYV